MEHRPDLKIYIVGIKIERQVAIFWTDESNVTLVQECGETARLGFAGMEIPEQIARRYLGMLDLPIESGHRAWLAVAQKSKLRICLDKDHVPYSREVAARAAKLLARCHLAV